MKVSVVFDDPTVQVAGANDALELELVAHLLGMATHDNDNGPPAVGAAPLGPTRKMRGAVPGLTFLAQYRAAVLAQDQEADVHEAYLRALNEALGPMRLPSEPKSPVSRLFEELYCPTG